MEIAQEWYVPLRQGLGIPIPTLLYTYTDC